MPDDTDDRARRERAARRRATWGPGEIVPHGAAKSALHEGTSPTERFHLLWELTQRAWSFAGKEIVSVPRDQLPGEVFDIRAERARTPR